MIFILVALIVLLLAVILPTLLVAWACTGQYNDGTGRASFEGEETGDFQKDEK